MTTLSTSMTPGNESAESVDRLRPHRGVVLVVEDDPSQRRLLVRLLERMGHTVAASDHGEAAMSWLDDHPSPGLVCLDLGLPTLSGFRVCEQIRASPRHRGVPILAITARTSIQDHTFALEVGADAFLEKPFKWRELERQVLQLLRDAS